MLFRSQCPGLPGGRACLPSASADAGPQSGLPVGGRAGGHDAASPRLGGQRGRGTAPGTAPDPFGSAAFSAAGFYLIGALGLWTPLLQTLALLVAAFLFILVIGFPLGILMARSQRLHRWLSPVLDIIQTMPSFVYLIPVLMLFGAIRKRDMCVPVWIRVCS